MANTGDEFFFFFGQGPGLQQAQTKTNQKPNPDPETYTRPGNGRGLPPHSVGEASIRCQTQYLPLQYPARRYQWSQPLQSLVKQRRNPTRRMILSRCSSTELHDEVISLYPIQASAEPRPKGA
ncbi:uncharacterized protein DS421_8g247520 [Arachis hypogaea]|nr:uncharacterized protein DS421_8g247520 [Arachis hypogaea]